MPEETCCLHFFLSFFVHISLESVLLCNMAGKFSGVLVRLICAIFRKVKKKKKCRFQ